MMRRAAPKERDACAMGSAMGTGALRIAVKDAATNRRMLAVMAHVAAQSATQQLSP